jgi:ribulose-phosphate 3-epimerase
MRCSTGADMFADLRRERPLIAPSMLKCDFGNLADEIRRLDAAGADVIHWDVMDAHFVPNLSYGALVIERLRGVTNLPFDAHLMVSDPAKYLAGYLRAGCDWITVHIEAVPNPSEILQEIRQAGRRAGLALNPGTPVSAVAPYFKHCDIVLVMSVEPGFGGQSFIPAAITKVAEIRRQAGEQLVISIDGGIAVDTIAAPFAAGADIFVAGSSIFNSPDYGVAVRHLQAAASQVCRPS